MSCIDWPNAGSDALPIYSSSLLSQLLVDFVSLNNFIQHNSVYNNRLKVLDLILCNFPNVNPNSKMLKSNFYKGDYEKIISELDSKDWIKIFAECEDVNSMVDLFYEILDKLITQFVPKTKLHIRSEPIWFSKELIRLNKEKIKTLHSANGTEICNFFARHFSSSYSGSVTGSGVVDFNDSVNSGYDVNTIGSLHISKHKIYLYLKRLDSSKGAGDDGIPSYFVAKCYSALTLPLYLIYNRSLSTGIFPTKWKTAKVVPVFKKGNHELVSNYRPITILNVFAKIFEVTPI
ncbi:unnamed protein product [Euphydryas editha]|uniref:Maturase K n=1 Tax=Euphydryas editha TaxID=104508 RepID=A0AAU9TS49_EUPED|nr:unnamed protein product [Euphydryas editha]